jgi:uncharacterized membrane protein
MGESPTDVETKEEEIERLLEEHGGRMKQNQIVERVDWSKATVSRVLSAMTDDDRVVKMPVGRENLVILNGYDHDPLEE